MFRYGDKWLFLPGILCLGTGIKSYFCLRSCLGTRSRVVSALDLVFRYWDKWLFLPGILCLGTGIKSYL